MTWIGPIKLFWKVAIKIVLWCCQISWQALHESRHQKRFNKHILTLSRHSITFESEVILIFVTVSMYQLSNSRVSWSEILFNFLDGKLLRIYSYKDENHFAFKKKMVDNVQIFFWITSRFDGRFMQRLSRDLTTSANNFYGLLFKKFYWTDSCHWSLFLSIVLPPLMSLRCFLYLVLPPLTQCTNANKLCWVALYLFIKA